MANRYANPDIQYFTADGITPAAGYQLFFYVSGTSTKLNTYSDANLTAPNANPVVLDSAGRAGAIFLQTLQYKVMLCPSTDTDPPTSPIWTQDPVYTSDYSTTAKFLSGSGSPNGTIAGTAGSATTSADAYWDYTNDILYVCTTTGTALTAVWTAVNASSAAAVVPPPQGYLTPTSGTAIITGDVVAATTLYYTPYTGLLVPIYNGTSFVPTSIVSELQYTLTSNLSANTIYDLFVFSNSGVPTLGSGPSWAAGTGGNITAGSCARGTGAGGAALSRLQGIWTNAVSMTVRYGDGTTTATIPANQATYVGTIYIDATGGQVTCHRGYGQNRKWGIWNAYNRVPVYLKAGDSTASWNYNTNTVRAANAAPASWSSTEFNVGSGTACNGMTVLSGLAEEVYNIRHLQFGTFPNTAGATIAGAFIGVNSTTSGSGKGGKNSFGGATIGIGVDLNAGFESAPVLGITTICALEQGNGTATNTWSGTEGSQLLTCEWRA